MVSKILKISEPTLRKHYRDELDTSKAKANAVISQALFKQTTGALTENNAINYDIVEKLIDDKVR